MHVSERKMLERETRRVKRRPATGANGNAPDKCWESITSDFAIGYPRRANARSSHCIRCSPSSFDLVNTNTTTAEMQGRAHGVSQMMQHMTSRGFDDLNVNESHFVAHQIQDAALKQGAALRHATRC